MKLGPYAVDVPVMLAPMAGMSDLPYREICRAHGAGYAVGEMTTCQPQFRTSRKSATRWACDAELGLRVVQLLGADPAMMADAARYAEDSGAQVVDINMGCPVSKVIKAEAGAKWLLDPGKVYEMVSAVVDAVDKPVTVKMRTGWDSDHLFAVENALAAERAGAAAVAMHGRTRVQMYEGHADWNIFKDVKQALKRIPLLGNGDVKSPEDAKRMMDETGVDGVMIGRAALSNPWMIKQTVHYLETGEMLPQSTPREKLEIAKLHLDRLTDLKGETVAVKEFRSIAAYYLKGIPRASKTKAAVTSASRQQEVVDLLDRFIFEVEEREASKEARTFEKIEINS